MLLPVEGHGGQAVEGAFGRVFGARFDPIGASDMGLSKSEMWFTFIPPAAALPLFNNFRVLVTPLNYQIHSILAENPLGDPKACRKMARSLFATVAEKYDGEEYGTKLLVNDDKGTFLVDQQKPGRRIYLHCDEAGLLSILYEDQNLKKQATDEHQEWNQLSDDFQSGRYQTSVPRLRELADKGHMHAEFLVGYAYRRGLGVAQDDAQAEAYYLRAANKGMVEAQYNLGTFQLQRNRLDAAQPWLLRAAEHGYPEAQENLAQLYLRPGALYNEAEAFQWFIKAAEAGKVEAQYNACHMYSAGDGVARDEVKAYQWCDIAATSGHQMARDNREFIAKRMTAQQVSRAKLLSQQWLAAKRGK